MELTDIVTQSEEQLEETITPFVRFFSNLSAQESTHYHSAVLGDEYILNKTPSEYLDL